MDGGRREVAREPLRRRPFGERSHSPSHEERRDRLPLEARPSRIARRGGTRRRRVT